METKTTEQSPTDTHNDKLRETVESALLSADVAGESYGSKASRITEAVIEALQSERSSMDGEIAGIADRLLRQADCLDRYAEQSGFPEKPVPSVFHLQSSHFRDLAKELAALNRSAKL